ncbi:MAG: hypothetical protein A2X56_05510 [Nitrospirae bacterium GWC2_57_13]|jgi:tetratricopeptide (TPR) repeat protein|nr:MAG: hypothetical protein A2X56_05510 [Nitrospirae bacterium GWC2_57_13]
MGSRTKTYGIVGFLAAALFFRAIAVQAAENPKDRLDYWQKNFGELKQSEDPRAARAHAIFNRVLDAAGKRPGVLPQLFIVKSDAAYIPLAFAIPDGGVIISKKVLDICYTDPTRGDDRLAFILAHEIAHQFKDDFWHMKFFQAIDISREKGSSETAVLNEVKAIAESTEKVLAKELQADEYGIVYASLAGYDTDAIVKEDKNVNFFQYFYQSLDPENIKGVKKDPTHPTPPQRAEAVKARLRQVLEKVELFRLGLLFYQAGEYGKAVKAFAEFLRYYPGREVYHNLAASRHQLALKYYREWKGEESARAFKLSIAVDPETRAGSITLRGEEEGPEARFTKQLSKAVENYEKAVSLDPSYALSYNNLGCALILQGEYYKAVAVLKDALKRKADYPEALNNLGVAFWYAENPAKAKENLLKARELSPAYDAPLYNLAKIAVEEKNAGEGTKYGEAYLKLDPAGSWADVVRSALTLEKPKELVVAAGGKKPEMIMGLQAGGYEDEVPRDWGKPVTSGDVPLEEEPLRTAKYANGVMTVSQDDEILLVVAPEGYKGRSSRGIGIGSSQQDLLKAYGAPSRTLDTAQGTSWAYQDEKVAFQIRDGKVISWMLF